MKEFFCLVGLQYFLGFVCLAQEDHHDSEDHQQGKEHKHSISVELGHTALTAGIKNGEKQGLSVPSWAFNYNYLINHRWSVGLHTDVVIEKFEVVNKRPILGEVSEIERSYPVSIVGAAMYKPLHFLSLVVGAGAEYAPEETFAIIRLGLEPSVELSHKWEMIFSMVYDVKIDAYNSWTMGVGVARLF